MITNAVGTMWCAYVFAAIALVSLPAAIGGGVATLIAWVAQTFLQLVLLSVIMVGQKVAAAASDKQALQTYTDAEALWPAPGFEDTEIGVLMEPEVGHGTTEVYARVQA